MSGPGHSGEPAGPVAQSLRLGFGALRLGTIVLALVWLASGIRQVPPEMQAAVLRFGRLERLHPPGLVLAWPRPFEQVELLPGAARQHDLHVLIGTAGGPTVTDPASALAGEVPPAAAGLYLSGDGGVVLLDVTLTWQVVDAAAYYRAAAHVGPALRRLTEAAAVAVVGARGLDDILSARGDADPQAEQRRLALRADLRDAINRRLAGLQDGSGGLGVQVGRVDVTGLLPPAAKFAFDAVLEATQMAEQGRAAAQIDAARTAQAADQQHDQIIAEATADAAERVAGARATVASIAALSAEAAGSDRATMLERLYRARIGGILGQAGSVTTLDAGARVILPGARP